MERLVLALALAAVAVGVVLVLQRRERVGPTDAISEFRAPTRLDRADFDRPDAPWLVAVFTSATCSTCADVWAKSEVLRSEQVVVQQIEAVEHPELHRRYDVQAVPIVAIADARGAVGSSFMGPVSSTHLWAALADLRAPGSVPPGCGGH
ncbi:MAG: thioredoxin domain-containing protein [Microthrixaceae bacterium]